MRCRLAILILLIGGLLFVGPLAAIARAQDATPLATPTTEEGLPAGVEVVANLLTNPRGFTQGPDGAIYLGQAGVGGSTPGGEGGMPNGAFFGGDTASVVRIEDGCAVPVAEGLPSGAWVSIGWIWGVSDVAFRDGELYALIGGGGPFRGHPDTPNGVYRIGMDGSATMIADLSAWFRENPVAFIPWENPTDGSWVGLEADADGFWVSEAVSGWILRVSPDGAIAAVADLSEGHLVPTGIALAPQGGVYVGYETAIPYPVGGSKISHVAADGTVTDAWTGLTRVTDVAVGPDGTLYAVEMDRGDATPEELDQPNTGRIVRQTGPDGLEPVATELNFPTDLEFDGDGMLYVDYPGVPTGTGGGQGVLLRIDPAAGPVSLAGLGAQPPTCEEIPDATGAAATPGTASAEGPVVTIEGFVFAPRSLEVAAGTTVTWTNRDAAPHTVTDSGAFDSARLDKGASYRHAFTKPGTYAYLCVYHPGMTGAVVVRGRPPLARVGGNSPARGAENP